MMSPEEKAVRAEERTKARAEQARRDQEEEERRQTRAAILVPRLMRQISLDDGSVSHALGAARYALREGYHETVDLWLASAEKRLRRERGEVPVLDDSKSTRRA